PPTLNNRPRAESSTERTSVRSLISAMQAELAAKLAIDGIAAVGLIEQDMRKAVPDGAIKRLCRYRQIHRLLPCCRKPFVGPMRQIDRACFSFCTEASMASRARCQSAGDSFARPAKVEGAAR